VVLNTIPPHLQRQTDDVNPCPLTPRRLSLVVTGRSYRDFLLWFSSLERAGYYMLARSARATVSPLLYLLTVIIIKNLVIGRFRPGPWTGWKTFQ
jgi:hypothetical protein